MNLPYAKLDSLSGNPYSARKPFSTLHPKPFILIQRGPIALALAQYRLGTKRSHFVLAFSELIILSEREGSDDDSRFESEQEEQGDEVFPRSRSWRRRGLILYGLFRLDQRAFLGIHL
jgi:hypothetical protein